VHHAQVSVAIRQSVPPHDSHPLGRDEAIAEVREPRLSSPSPRDIIQVYEDCLGTEAAVVMELVVLSWLIPEDVETLDMGLAALGEEGKSLGHSEGHWVAGGIESAGEARPVGRDF